MAIALSVVEKRVDPDSVNPSEIEIKGDSGTETVVPLVCINRATAPEVAGEPSPQPDQKPDIQPRRQRLDASALRRLSDLVLLPTSMLPPQDRAFATDLLHTVLGDVGVDFRIQLAGRLARMGKIAPSLIARLVRDEDIAVAAPLLRFSEAVADMDLIDILRSGCQERATIIAGRKDLSADIVSGIAAHGNVRVILTLFQNRCVRFDSVTMARLSKRVVDDADLSEALLERLEMNPGCALDLFWSVNRKLRLYVLNRFLQDGQIVRKILDACSDGAGLQHADPAATPDAAGAGARGAMRKSETQERLISIAQLMTQADSGDAARMLAALTSVSVPTAANIVADPGGEAIAVAFKAAGASRTTFSGVCELWLKSDDAPLRAEKEFEAIFEQFDRLSRGQARMAMAYWDWRENRIGPYAPTLEIQKAGLA